MSDLPPPPDQPDQPVAPTSGLPYPLQPPTEKADLPSSGPGSLGSIWARIGAQLADRLIVLAPFIFFGGSALPDEAETARDIPLWLLLGPSVIWIAYQTIMVANRGQTFGKMLTRIKIVRYADGELLTPAQSAIRVIVPTAPALIAVALPDGVGSGVALLEPLIYLSAVIDVLYRGLHDRAAGSIVLRTT